MSGKVQAGKLLTAIKLRTHDQQMLANMFANSVGKQKSVVCSKSWPTFYVGQQCLRLRTCSFFVGQQTANRALWLAGSSKHHDAVWTDASCVDYTNYTSPFCLYIIHDCIQSDFGRLYFRLQAIKQITAAATSSSTRRLLSPAISAILLSNKMLSCVTQMFANNCWPTNVDQQLFANICWSCVCGLSLRWIYSVEIERLKGAWPFCTNLAIHISNFVRSLQRKV